MKCENPYLPRSHRAYYRCMRCLACREYNRQIWSTRLILEALDHTDCAFITLTYKNEALPSDNTLVKADLQSYQKRLRRVLDYKVRFYSVGEYGDNKGRPHYHLLVFGLKLNDWLSAYHAWQNKGIVEIQKPRARQSVASYVSGYVTKKIGSLKAQSDFFGGRLPPFQLQSKGLGASIIDKMNTYSPFILIGGKQKWLGRHLINKAQLKFFDSATLEAHKNEVKLGLSRDMAELEFAYRDKYLSIPPQSRTSDLFRFAYREHNLGHWQNLHEKDKLFNSRTKDLQDFEKLINSPPELIPPVNSPYSTRKLGKIYEWSENCVKIGAS